MLHFIFIFEEYLRNILSTIEDQYTCTCTRTQFRNIPFFRVMKFDLFSAARPIHQSLKISTSFRRVRDYETSFRIQTEELSKD